MTLFGVLLLLLSFVCSLCQETFGRSPLEKELEREVAKHAASSKAAPPPSGSWEGTCTEGHKPDPYKCFHNFEFSEDGKMSGTCKRRDRRAMVRGFYYSYNAEPETIHVIWLEESYSGGFGFLTLCRAQLRDELITGRFKASSGSTGTFGLNRYVKPYSPPPDL